MSNIDRIRPIAEPIIFARGFLLYDIEAHGPVVRVTVNGVSNDESPSIDDLSAISRELSHILDDRDLINASYTLEVSTPGLERKLRTPQHFSGAKGEIVSLKLRRGVDGSRRVRGVIEEANETSLRLLLQEANDSVEIAFDDIDSARTVFEWGPTRQPAAPRGVQVAQNRRSTP